MTSATIDRRTGCGSRASEAALHRRLAALEVQLVDVALGARLLALLAAAGGLAEAGADAATDAPLFGDGPFGRRELGENVSHDVLPFDFLHRDEVQDLLDHAAERRRVRDDDLGARAAQAEALRPRGAAGAGCR